MNPLHIGPGGCGITRRGFLVGAGAGLAAGLPLGWCGLKAYQHWTSESPFTGRTTEVPTQQGMPGPFPGRVVEVRSEEAVKFGYLINDNAVYSMMDRGMCELTGADVPADAWKRFFQRGDVVGIKVNPVGRAYGAHESGSRRPEIGSISSFPVVIAVVAGLKSAGVRPRDIIIYERYFDEFKRVYGDLMNEPWLDGVRWFGSSADYSNTQLAIDGYDNNKDRNPQVAGYDPDVFVSMGFCYPGISARDDRRFRSHLSTIVTRMCNKIVTIPCLKDHRSAGVTLALKNLSHGMNNNVGRSHIGAMYRPGGAASSPNQCNTFISTAATQQILRQKATLHILDGLIGVYEGGPGAWNYSWGTWPRKSLFFATDPVAMDIVGWHIIDMKRFEEGWAPVAHMGMMPGTTHMGISPRLAALAAMGSPEAAAIALAEHQARHPRPESGEAFDRRQPEHILLAGTLGLGEWDMRKIEHRTIRV
jgi:hypothetical protein